MSVPETELILITPLSAPWESTTASSYVPALSCERTSSSIVYFILHSVCILSVSSSQSSPKPINFPAPSVTFNERTGLFRVTFSPLSNIFSSSKILSTVRLPPPSTTILPVMPPVFLLVFLSIAFLFPLSSFLKYSSDTESFIVRLPPDPTLNVLPFFPSMTIPLRSRLIFLSTFIVFSERVVVWGLYSFTIIFISSPSAAAATASSMVLYLVSPIAATNISSSGLGMAV